MKGIFAILGGLGVGATFMYFFDPNEGNRRRALLRDKAVSFNHKAQDAMTGRAKDLSNRAKGLLHKTGLATGEHSEMASQQSVQ
jgi:hypothetical protein